MNLRLPILALALCAISTVASAANPLEVLSSSSNEFSSNLFEVVKSENGKGKNLIFSSLSAFIALSMLEQGARGKTTNLMRQSLHLPNNKAVINLGLKNLIDDFNNVTKVDLEIANKIFVSKNLKVKDEFIKLTKEIFKSEAEYIDVNNPTGVAKTVNNWVGVKTHEKIKNIINPDDITKQTIILLVNALYFKGKWAKTFRKEATQELEFFKNENSQVKVPTMHARGTYMYGQLEDLKAQFIQLPYENKELEMVIIVPDEKEGLSEIEEKLESFNYNELSSVAYKTDVNLFLPKFKIESSIDLEKPFIQIGLAEIFKSPNLSGIVNGNFAVSKAKQKAFIEVNEEGTEAAAVTVIQGIRRSSLAKPRPITLRVDRPFYFLIRKLQTVIFQGHVYNPLA